MFIRLINLLYKIPRRRESGLSDEKGEFGLVIQSSNLKDYVSEDHSALRPRHTYSGAVDSKIVFV